MEFIIDPDATMQPEIPSAGSAAPQEAAPAAPPETVAAVEAAPVEVQSPAAEVPPVPETAVAQVEQPARVVSPEKPPATPAVERLPRQKDPLVKEVEGFFVDQKVMGLWEGLPPALQAQIKTEGEHEAEVVAQEVKTGMKHPRKAFAGVRKFYDLFPSPTKDRSYYTQQTWLAFKKAQDKAEELKLNGQNQM